MDDNQMALGIVITVATMIVALAMTFAWAYVNTLPVDNEDVDA